MKSEEFWAKVRNSAAPKTETVYIPEWDASVTVRGLKSAERDRWELGVAERRRDGKDPLIRASLLALTLIDDEGNPLVSNGQMATLGQTHATLLEKCVGVAQRLSGITAEDVEQLEGNSDATSGDASPSA